ncbi:MAG: ATPase domain-containing protein [Candidatus Diapherotrites archaeon]
MGNEKRKIDVGKIIGSGGSEKNGPAEEKKTGGDELREMLTISPMSKTIAEETARKALPQEDATGTKKEDVEGKLERKLEEMEEKLNRLQRTQVAASPAPVSREESKNGEKLERVPSGITGLDELIDGGFERGSTILVTGGAGTGKTTIAMQFLYYGAMMYNEPGILISFEETKQSLYKHHAEFGWDFAELEKRNLFQILEYKPHQVNNLMEQGGGPIRDAIKSLGAKRLAIDSITSYGLLFRDDYQERESILDFFDLLKKWGCTSIVISEMPPKVAEVKEGSVGFLTDAIISLYYSKDAERDVRVHSLEILKMRGTKHTNKVCALTFEKNGIVIYPDIEVF